MSDKIEFTPIEEITSASTLECVYVVNIAYKIGGYGTRGVYSTKAKAQSAINKLTANNGDIAHIGTHYIDL